MLWHGERLPAQYGMWDVGCGMWDMGYGIWDMGYDGIWDVGYDGIWDVGYDGIWDVGYDGIWDVGYAAAWKAAACASDAGSQITRHTHLESHIWKAALGKPHLESRVSPALPSDGRRWQNGWRAGQWVPAACLRSGCCGVGLLSKNKR
jgi:hypothetical protein